MKLRLARWLLGYTPMPEPTEGGAVLVVRDGAATVAWHLSRCTVKTETRMPDLDKVFGDTSTFGPLRPIRTTTFEGEA